MKRKLLTILLTLVTALCLCFAFAACDNGSGNNGNTDNGSADTEQNDPPHVHSFTDYVYNDDATCSEDGTETATCSCGITDTRTKEGTALGHSFETYTPNGDVTCTKNGTETAKCVRCTVTDTREDDDSALGHNMKPVAAKEPTCTEIGWDAYMQCSRCQEKENYVEKEILGHDMQPVAAQEPTCTEEGWEEYEKCSRCEETKGYTAVPPSHTITETYTPKQCNGKKAFVHRSCSKCDFEEDETIEDISALIYRSGYSKVNGRITAAGYTVANIAGGYGELTYKWEIFSSETSVTPAKVLDYSENNVLEMSGYSGLNGQIVQVTIKDNYSNYTVFRCVVSEEESIPGVTDKTEPFKIFGGEHNYQSVKTDPTCTEQGYTTYTCADCGDNYVDDYTDPLGHEYQKDVCIRCAQHTGLLYVRSGDHYVLIGIGTCTEKNIVIAEEYEGLPVTEIGYGAFNGCDDLISVTFEEPSGWKLGNSQALDATQLQTPAIAAAFLSKTYCDQTWTRETKQ